MIKPHDEVPRITAPEVWTRLRGGEDLLLVCANGPSGEARGPGLPGALTLADLRALLDVDPRREIVFFSRGPEDADAVRRAEEFRRRGHPHVSCVEGGEAALRAVLERPCARFP